MYRNNFVKGDTVLHTIDFNTLKKMNPPICKINDDDFVILHHSNQMLLILGVFSVIHETVSITDMEFIQFPFQSVPKQFQQFMHQKTFSEVIKILRNRAKSLEVMVQMLNNYPIFVCVLECWVRKRALVWIESHGSTDLLGNEHQLLADLGVSIRGSLAGIVASSLRIFLRTRFQMFRASDETLIVEEFGEESSRWESEITFQGKGIVSGKIIPKEDGLSTSKGNQCGFLRRSKVAEVEVQPRNGPEFRSMKKERMGPCEKCGLRRCDCNQLKRKGLGVTPKNNQLSNSAIGNKNEPFAFGFLNQHNLSKIREPGQGQK